MKKIALAIILASVLLIYVRTYDSKHTNSQTTSSAATLPSKNLNPPATDSDSPSPEDAVSDFMLSIKNWDVNNIKQYLPDGTIIEEHIPRVIRESAVEATARMTYVVEKISVSGDTAAIKMKITAVNINNSLNSVINAVIAYIAKEKLLGRPTPSEDQIALVISNAIKIDSLPLVTTSTVLYMQRQSDGVWKPKLSSRDNMEFVNAISGGFLDIIDNIKQLAADYGITI